MRRRWGQHFLRDDATARRIVRAAEVEPGEAVLEIGPGTGRLTRALLEVAATVVAVEIDPALAAELPARLGDDERLAVIEGDATRVDLEEILETRLGGRARAMGNLPYETSTAILVRLLDLLPRLTAIAVVVQQEVADRITAQPGGREYGYLSVVCQDVADARRALALPPGAFRPPPAVRSALLRLEPLPQARRGAHPAAEFRRFVGGLFGQRRKTLVNNLRASCGLDREGACAALERAGLRPAARPEELAPEEFAALLEVVS